MAERLSEKYEMFNEVFSITSATTSQTGGYSMHDCEQITFVCGMGTQAGAATAITQHETIKKPARKILHLSLAGYYA